MNDVLLPATIFDNAALYVTTGLYPDPDHGPFLLAIYWGEHEGGLEPFGIELRSLPRPLDWGGEPYGSPLESSPRRTLAQAEPLTTEIIRGIPLREIAENFKRDEPALLAWWASREPQRRAELERRALVWQRSQGKRTGPRGRSLEWWVNAAEVWNTAQQKGEPPLRALTDWLDDGRRRTWAARYSSAQKIVEGLRRRGMVPRPTRKEGKS